MKRFFIILLALMLAATAFMPAGALAASSSKSSKKIIYIITIDNDGTRVRSTPRGGSLDNVMTSLRKGTRLFYLGTEGAWYKVCSEYSTTTGYVYKGYASYYGAVALDSIYKCNGSTRMYRRANTSSSRVTTLKDGQFVIVCAVSGQWAYVRTISGYKGYVRTSSLKSIS